MWCPDVILRVATAGKAVGLRSRSPVQVGTLFRWQIGKEEVTGSRWSTVVSVNLEKSGES